MDVWLYFCPGEMAERSNAAVLKTVDCYRSGGSNPSLSAKALNYQGFYISHLINVLNISKFYEYFFLVIPNF